jgi:hypothetical protein
MTELKRREYNDGTMEMAIGRAVMQIVFKICDTRGQNKKDTITREQEDKMFIEAIREVFKNRRKFTIGILSVDPGIPAGDKNDPF